MIVEVATNIRNYEILKNTCKLKLYYFNNYKYEIEIIPGQRNQNVILKYKKLVFRCNDITGYERVCRYLLDSFKQKIDEYVRVAMEWDNYVPPNDDNFDKNMLSISVDNEDIFKEDFNLYNIAVDNHNDTILRHLLPLYFLTINN